MRTSSWRWRRAETAARSSGRSATIEELEASGLRGRGGAGFPTGTKWRTVAERVADAARRRSSSTAPRASRAASRTATLLARNPYRVLEGALIAAARRRRRPRRRRREGARSPSRSPDCVERAIDGASRAAGWADGIDARIVRGPERVPVRRGDGAARGHRGPAAVPAGRPAVPPRADESVTATIGAGRAGRRPTPRRRWPTTSRRWPTSPLILANGATWFRELGTAASPGHGRLHRVSGSTQRGRRRRGADGHAAARGDRRDRRRAGVGRRGRTPCCPGSPTRSCRLGASTRR